jgi:nicotinamidase-related amidase
MFTQAENKAIIDEREEYFKKVDEAYKYFLETGIIRYPGWLYDLPKEDLFRAEVEDYLEFGKTAELEFDFGRTAFISVDTQQDSCRKDGYIDTMGYDLLQTQCAVDPITNVLETVRDTDIDFVHTREGHDPQLTDAPFNKLLRSKIADDGHCVGETPHSGISPLLIRGHENWDIINELTPEPGELVVGKPTKGAFGNTNIEIVLEHLGSNYIVISSTSTDVCVHIIMREANDRGYWCMLLKDAAGATDPENYDAAIKQIKMQAGVFGWVSDSGQFIDAVERDVA